MKIDIFERGLGSFLFRMIITPYNEMIFRRDDMLSRLLVRTGLSSVMTKMDERTKKRKNKRKEMNPVIIIVEIEA